MSYIRHSRAPASFNDIQGLTPAKARAEVARRHIESKGLLTSYRAELASKGADLNYSLETLVDVFIILASKLRLEQKAPPDDLPKWLSDLKDEIRYDFTFDSVPIVIALGFYLGDTLIRNFECIEWRIGVKSRVYYGQPYLWGYFQTRFRAESPVMLVANNILRLYIERGYKRSEISDRISVHIENAQASLAAWKTLNQAK
jgi:hypothetical protein